MNPACGVGSLVSSAIGAPPRDVSWAMAPSARENADTATTRLFIEFSSCVIGVGCGEIRCAGEPLRFSDHNKQWCRFLYKRFRSHWKPRNGLGGLGVLRRSARETTADVIPQQKGRGPRSEVS